MKRAFRTLALAVLAVAAGCMTNYYEQSYSPLDDADGFTPVRSSVKPADVELRLAGSEDDVLDIIEAGFAPVGVSAFEGEYEPLAGAVDTAVEQGASLALVDIRFKETRQRSSVVYVPTYYTTYVTGWDPPPPHRHYHHAHPPLVYSETYTTTGWNAVPVQQNVDIYTHNVMFFRKIDVSGLYGVELQVPKRLPDEPLDSAVEVRVKAVFRGSPAERDGIRRGQIVKSVNGRPIKTRADVEPFLERGNRSIAKLEVEDAK